MAGRGSQQTQAVPVGSTRGAGPSPPPPGLVLWARPLAFQESFAPGFKTESDLSRNLWDELLRAIDSPGRDLCPDYIRHLQTQPSPTNTPNPPSDTPRACFPLLPGPGTPWRTGEAPGPGSVRATPTPASVSAGPSPTPPAQVWAPVQDVCSRGASGWCPQGGVLRGTLLH